MLVILYLKIPESFEESGLYLKESTNKIWFGGISPFLS